ncbi:MAG: cell division protein ZapE [Rickettsiaceae bacterium]|nr:cell division protein ZapE [Rickettsiaceae bacterium]
MKNTSKNIEAYIQTGVKLDNQQKSLIQKLDEIKKSLEKNYFMKFFSSQSCSGIYIHGPVGRGKSVILKAFFEASKQTKVWYHYQQFIQFIHEESHEAFEASGQDAIVDIAEKISSKYSLIVIDELEIRDITDAMIIHRISKILLSKGNFLCFTSNIKPSDIYLNGLQRELLMDFIRTIESKFFTFNLDNGHDYRFSKAASSKQIITEGYNENNLTLFEELKHSITKGHKLTQTDLEIFGRKIIFERTYKKAAFVTLEEICDNELSYNDFLEISENFSAIVLEAETNLQDDSDKVIRFINFIDSLYDSKLLLIAIFKDKIASLYKGKKYKKEFGRALSRIAEMSSNDYITTSKYYKGA